MVAENPEPPREGPLSPESEPSDNPFAKGLNVTVSVPQTVEVRMVDAAALSDYEVLFFISSILGSAVVGFFDRLDSGERCEIATLARLFYRCPRRFVSDLCRVDAAKEICFDTQIEDGKHPVCAGGTKTKTKTTYPWGERFNKHTLGNTITGAKRRRTERIVIHFSSGQTVRPLNNCRFNTGSRSVNGPSPRSRLRQRTYISNLASRSSA